MDEVPEEVIQEAEADELTRDHDHAMVSGEDGTLRAHLEELHELDAPSGMSASTQAGLHDRLHGDTGAADA